MMVLPGVWPGAAMVSIPGNSGPLPSHGSTRSSIGASFLVAPGVRADEMPPVALVTAVGGVREHDLAMSGGPAHVVEVEMGQDDVGDVGRADAFGCQPLE